MFDSAANFMIQISNDPGCQCFIGIFTTVTNHYIAWLSVFLRAYRIGKFFDIYEGYLDINEKQQMMSSQLRLTLPIDIDTKQDEEEDIILEDFNTLKETRLLKRHMAIFISSITALGISAFFFPYLYSVVPVYETQ